MAAATTRWTNWGGTAECSPARVVTAPTEERIAEAVRDAGRDGLRVRVVGAGHSFTDVACTDGVMLRLDGHDRVRSADPATGLVEVEAGITLLRLNEELAARGLAMENLGDIAYQTIAGAISTATHGTGARLGNLSAQIRGIRLITADGQAIDCGPEELLAARVSVGALGVISAVTLQAVPAFNLHAVERPGRFDEVLDQLDALADGNDHFELYWFPHTDRVQTLRNNRTDGPARPRGRASEFLNDVLLENHAFNLICRIGRARPAWVPRLARFTANRWGASERVDRSDRVFASPRLVRFAEMEYAIPRVHAAAALREVRARIERLGLRIGFPVELRFAAADDAFLSTAHGRDTAYVACHVYRGVDHQRYFREAEAIMRGFEGRPHWGKLHFRTAEDLAPAYPQWERFRAVRQRLDPEDRFANAYTERVLGAETPGAATRPGSGT